MARRAWIVQRVRLTATFSLPIAAYQKLLFASQSHLSFIDTACRVTADCCNWHLGEITLCTIVCNLLT